MPQSEEVRKVVVDQSIIRSFQELRALFKSIDSDGSESLSLKEVIIFLKSITDDISDENIEKIFHSLDASGDRAVDFDEFMVSLFDEQIIK